VGGCWARETVASLQQQKIYEISKINTKNLPLFLKFLLETSRNARRSGKFFFTLSPQFTKPSTTTDE
jgi:hypothetical protein